MPSLSRFIRLALVLLVPAAAFAQVGPPVVPGFPNVPQVPGRLLSGLNAPEQGRTAIIAYHGGVLVTVPEVPSSQPGADFQVRTWDISDPASPVETGQLGLTPMPINAHGYLQSGPYLAIGPNWPPDAPWSFRTAGSGTPLERIAMPGLDGMGVRGNLFQPWFVGQTWWTYGPVTGNAVIELRGQRLAEWDHLGQTGVIGHPFLIGDLLIFASDQSRTGVATYDVSDPRNPVLLDVLTTGGAGGYWPEVWGGDGRLLVAFPYREGGNGLRVVDASDPRDLRFVADTPLPGAECMYLQFQDERAFTGDHVVDMRTFQSVLDLDGANVARTNGPGTGVDTSQFALPLGNLLVTGGVGPNEGMAIWAHQAEPDTRGPSVGYHRPEAGRTGYPLEAPISLLIHETLETFTIVNGETFIVRPVGGAALPGTLIFAFDDILTFTPDAPLLPDTTYEVILPAGGIKDAAGNGLVGHSFTFSTGSSVAGNRPPVVRSVEPSAWPVAPGASVTLTADASDPDGDSLEYRFDFGDGSPRTAWGAASSAAHPYAEAGHYQATVQARDPAGALATGAVTVTVVAPSGPPPTRSTPIALDAGRRLVWVVSPDHDALSALDADTLELAVERPTCADPRSVAVAADGALWVTCHDADAIAVHDGDGARLATLPLGYGAAPQGLALSPDGTTAWVALEGPGALARLDVASRAETGRVALGPKPRAVAVSADGGVVHVTRFLTGRDDGEVYRVDAATLARLPSARLPKAGGDANRDTTAAGKGILNHVASLTLSPDGSRLWLAATKANAERGPLSGPDLDQDNTVRNVVVQVDTASRAVTRMVDIDNSDSASAVAYSPLGDYLFVALQGNDEVVVLDALRMDSTSGLGSLVTRLAAGASPQGLCFDPVTSRTFVQSLTTRSVTVLETRELFRVGARAVASSAVEVVTSDDERPELRLGKRLFYRAGDRRMSAEGYLSCATCHADGDHDGRTWDFTGRGEGLRNTTSLRGRAGTGHGNVHWTANFDEIQDFEGDIRGAFGGSGFLAEADWQATRDPLGAPKAGLSPDLAALAAYVASLREGSLPRSPHRAADGFLTAEARSGRDVFAREGCGSCHAGPSFTDSASGSAVLHDVGTRRTSSGGRLGGPLPGLDTPTLLGVFDTAPYLHDGSAQSLDDVFRLAGGVVVPAETGTPGGGANVVTQYTDLNNDDTLRGRAYADLNGGTLDWSGVDGGAGGTGALEIRYSAGWASSLDVVVNGVTRTIPVPATPNSPQWRQTYWRELRLEDVVLQPGATNDIRLAGGNLGIDEIVVTRADELAAAAPHRRVLALPAGERAALSAYVLQLDGRPEEQPPLGVVSLRVNALDVTWDAVAGAAGYDVARGDLLALRASRGDFSTAACEADDTPALAWPHATAGAGAHWFLARATAPGVPPGTWDGGSPAQAAPRDPALLACP